MRGLVTLSQQAQLQRRRFITWGRVHHDPEVLSAGVRESRSQRAHSQAVENHISWRSVALLLGAEMRTRARE